MRRIVRQLFLPALLSVTAFAQAQTPPAPPPDCKAPEYRQFDFWLGDWNVPAPKGQPDGHSHIETILAGCVISENWRGGSGFEGKSYNIYNRETGHWEQYWVDVSGARLHLVGGLVDGKMILGGVQDKPDAQTGIAQRERITWTPNADGSVRQLWESSKDDGKTWSVSFDGMYRHPAAKP